MVLQDACRPNWRHVLTFIGLTFSLTWLLNLAMYLGGGLASHAVVTTLQFQMLLPAASAIVPGLLWFPESPPYHRRRAGRPRWFYYFFLFLTTAYGVGALGAWLAPAQGALTMVAAAGPLGLAVISLLLLVYLRVTAGRELMASAWLAGGNWRQWLLFGLAFVAYYVAQFALNGVFGLGHGQLSPPPVVPATMTPEMFYVIAAVQSVLIAPILACVALADHSDGLQLRGPSLARGRTDDRLHEPAAV